MDAPTPPVLLLTSWHLPRMRSMPRAFWLARRLDRDGRAAPGCIRMHRWISRRSVLLTSWWESREAAVAWRATPTFHELDGRLRAIRGAEPRVEIREATWQE